MVPFFELKRQYESIGVDVERAVLEVMHSTAYIEGGAVKTFEMEMSEYLRVKRVITCANGTDALRIALQSLGISAGDEVITTPFSFFATAEAISQTGATPVFVDIREDTLNINADLIEKKITERTKAILPVHVFGCPADMDKINEIAEQHRIKVVEDACQAIGAEYKGKKTGSLGTLGCFSFYPTKNLGAFGDGGMITTDDNELAQCCIALKSHGAGKNGAIAYRNINHKEVEELKLLDQSGDGLYDPCKYFNYLIGGNSRLDSMQAAVLSVKLRKLEEYTQRRREIAKQYIERLSKKGIVLPGKEFTDGRHCYHQFPVLIERRDEFVEYMKEKGIGTGAFYPVPIHLQRAYEALQYQRGDLPIAESVCERSVCLPVFPELSSDEVDYVIDSVLEWQERS